MKKYLSLFVVLVMVFTISANVAKAEVNTGVSDTANATTGVKVDTKATLSPLQKRANAEAEIKAKKELLQAEIKIKKETLKGEIKDKREETKQQIETAREKAKQKMEELKTTIKLEKDSVKAKIKEERITGREKALERFDKTIKRIDNLKEKVNIQITKLETKAINVADAKSFLITAETKLNDAKAKIVEVNKLLSVSINELSLENKTALKTLTKEIQELIKEARQALNDAIKSLKNTIKIETKANADAKAPTTTETNQ